MLVLTSYSVRRPLMEGSLILNTNLMLCWAGSGSTRGDQIPLIEDAMIWAAHVDHFSQIRNYYLACSNLEFFRKAREEDNHYPIVSSIGSILYPLSFQGFAFNLFLQILTC